MCSSFLFGSLRSQQTICCLNTDNKRCLQKREDEIKFAKEELQPNLYITVTLGTSIQKVAA